jgi:NADH dehydrogenase (ubiquinone) flavoprotein 2
MALDFNEDDRAEIARIRSKYPESAAALLPVLHYAQRKFGCLPLEAQLLVAEALALPATRVHEVVTFYEMFHEHPEGQYHLEFCTNISCHLLGAEELLQHAKSRLGIEIGHMTDDGVLSLMEVECLASCGSGPMMKVGEDYYEQLTPESVDALIDRFKKEAPSLGGRPFICKNNKPHTGPVPGFESTLPVIGNAAPPPLPKAPEGGLPSFEAPKTKTEAKDEG